MQQPSLFLTGKQRESKLHEIDSQNLQAARIILEQQLGGLMEEWARRTLTPNADNRSDVHGSEPAPAAQPNYAPQFPLHAHQ